MAQYLKIYRNHEEYELDKEKPFISHCVIEVHIHIDNSYYYGSDDEIPCVDYEEGGRYYYPSNVSIEDCFMDGGTF